MSNLLDYFPQLAPKQLDQFKELEALLLDWNKKINLISRKDEPYLFTHHILHSLTIAKFTTIKSGESILDIGTGGGFPGIPLSIILPDSTFYLIDSIQKKIKVVTDIIQKLDLTNARAICARAEELTLQVDYVVSRAVAPIDTIVYWTKKHLKRTGPRKMIFLKGGDLNAEKKGFKVQEIPLKQYFNDAFFEKKKYLAIDF